jgi:hypothetical protein
VADARPTPGDGATSREIAPEYHIAGQYIREHGKLGMREAHEYLEGFIDRLRAAGLLRAAATGPAPAPAAPEPTRNDVLEEAARCVEQDPSRGNKWHLAARVRALRSSPAEPAAAPSREAVADWLRRYWWLAAERDAPPITNKATSDAWARFLEDADDLLRAASAPAEGTPAGDLPSTAYGDMASQGVSPLPPDDYRERR